MLGRLEMLYAWDWSGAERNLAHGTALSPSSVEAAESYGWFLLSIGRYKQALEELERAHQLDPSHWATLQHLGLAQWMAGRGERLTALYRDGAWRTAMVEWISYSESLNKRLEAAVQWMALHQTARALANLERMVARRGDGVPSLRAVPAFHALRGKPRFEDLLRSVALDDASLVSIRAAPRFTML